jgi:hypothetical protein
VEWSKKNAVLSQVEFSREFIIIDQDTAKKLQDCKRTEKMAWNRFSIKKIKRFGRVVLQVRRQLI